MQDLADAVNVKKTTVSMWENSGIVPREETLINLANYFNVSVDYLLGNVVSNSSENNSATLKHLQRGLNQMDEKQLKTAEKLLASVFDDLFDSEEDDFDGI